MTIRRIEDAVMLEDICVVEDAEVLMQQIQEGASIIDWSACTHLHTACLQVLLAAGLPMRGSAANPALARWLMPILQSEAAAAAQFAPADPEIPHRLEA